MKKYLFSVFLVLWLTAPVWADGCASGTIEGRQIIYTATGTAAAATATATATVPAPQNYVNLTKLEVTGLGATAAGSSTCTITGLQGGTVTYTIPVVAGATLSNTPFLMSFDTCPLTGIAATNVVAACTTFGTGNTAAAVVIHYFFR